MLALQIDGKNMDLGDDFSFTMNLKNPMFNDLGGYSYPFKLPNTPNNSRLIGFRHRVESTTDVYGLCTGMFTWNGHSLFTGQLKMEILNKSLLEGHLFESDSAFYIKAKKLLLTQFNFGEKIFANETDAINFLSESAHYAYPDIEFACPRIYNNLYFDPPTTDFYLKYYNRWIYDSVSNYLILTTTDDARTILVPMLYLRYILDVISEGMGMELIDELLTSHPDLNSLVLYNSLSCNSPFYPKPPEITHIVLNNHIPTLSLMDFIIAIENYFCASTFINGIRNTMRIIPRNKIINDESYINFSDNLLSISTELEEQIMGFDLKMESDGDDDSFTMISGWEEETSKRIKGSVNSIQDLPSWPLIILPKIQTTG
jgi:hypothetical protein